MPFGPARCRVLDICTPLIASYSPHSHSKSFQCFKTLIYENLHISFHHISSHVTYHPVMLTLKEWLTAAKQLPHLTIYCYPYLYRIWTFGFRIRQVADRRCETIAAGTRLAEPIQKGRHVSKRMESHTASFYRLRCGKLRAIPPYRKMILNIYCPWRHETRTQRWAFSRRLFNLVSRLRIELRMFARLRLGTLVVHWSFTNCFNMVSSIFFAVAIHLCASSLAAHSAKPGTRLSGLYRASAVKKAGTWPAEIRSWQGQVRLEVIEIQDKAL